MIKLNNFLVLITCLALSASTVLQMDKVYDLSLNAQKVANYEIVIPENWESNQNLYITGYSPINDPFQQPILRIKSNDFVLTCQTQQDSLDDVCLIPSSKLSKGQKFDVQAVCSIDCQAKLVAYLSRTIQLDLDQQIDIQSADSPIQKTLSIFVPTDAQFNEIHIKIRMQGQIFQHGVQMYVKTSKVVQFASKTSHDPVKLVSWGMDQAIILKKDVNVKPGDIINVLIVMGPDINLVFETRTVENNFRYLRLNQVFADFIEAKSMRLYVIDLTGQKNEYKKFPIAIDFYEYSGNPEIQVSLDRQFKSQYKIKRAEASWVRFEVQPKLMSSPTFKDIIYVRIKSQHAANYQILARVKESTYNFIGQGVTQFLKVQAGKLGYLTFLKGEMMTNQTRHIQIKVQNQGQVQPEVSVFFCVNQGHSKCKINPTDNLDSLSQNYKKAKVQTTKQILKINYQVADFCTKDKRQKAGQADYYCILLIVLTPKDKMTNGEYSVTVLKNNSIEILAEGQTYLRQVLSQKYKHFQFFLPGFADKIKQVYFYVHVISGNVQLLASKEITKPTFNDLKQGGQSKIKIGLNSISFRQGEARNGSFYLSVYGTQYSDFAVSAIVRRNVTAPSKPDTVNGGGMGGISINKKDRFQQKVDSLQFSLVEGLAQEHTITQQRSSIGFKFRTTGTGMTKLAITELIGKVKVYYTRQSNHARTLCYANDCKFDASRGQQFFVEVEGSFGKVQKFNILFKQIKQCSRYPVGAPIFVSLSSNDTQCLQFDISSQQIQISNSLTSIQLLNQIVQVVLQFEGKSTFLMNKNSHTFDKVQIQKYCQGKSSCNLKIKTKSFQYSAYFEIIVQKGNGILTLYDGVTQRVEQKANSAKYFRYPINKQQSAQVFLTSETSSDYTILTKIIDSKNYSDIQNYPKLSDDTSKLWTKKSSDDSSLTMLAINKNKLKYFFSQNKIQDPWLLISVFCQSEKQQSVYTIQVTQNQRIIKEGQSHIGFLEPREMVTYQVYSSSHSILTIRPLYNSKCFKIYDEDKKQTLNQILIQQPKRVPLQFFIEGDRISNCMYQISLQNFQNSFLVVSEGFPNRVILEYQQLSYLLYNHNENVTFRIYQFIEAGASTIYVTPLNNLKIQKNLDEMIQNIDLSTFSYKSDKIQNIEIKAQPNSSKYCFQCYYLIAVKGEPAVQENVVVVKEGTPLLLTQHSIVDSYIDEEQNQTFIYYSNENTKFNLSIDVVYGKVTVTVKSYDNGPEGKVVKIQTVENNMVNLPIADKDTRNFNGMGQSPFSQIPTDSLDQKWKYKIEVKGLKNSLYHLQIVKYADSYRIAQGIASQITIPARGSIDLQFDNLIDKGDISVSIEQNLFNNIPLSALVQFYKPGSSKRDRYPIEFKKQAIGRVLHINFASRRGHYIIRITNTLNAAFDFIALLPRPGLTEIREFHSIIASYQTIYELYINEDSYAIIEIYSCEGSLKVRGSSDIESLQKSKPRKQQINLLHQNSGGHYVITTPANVSGQYFIRVQNKDYSANIKQQVNGISYMINYRLHRNSQKNPYNVLDADSYQIKIQKGQIRQNISIYLDNIKSFDESVKVKSVQYIFAIGVSPSDVRNYMICQTAQDTKHLSYARLTNGTEKQISINVSKLEVLKKIDSKKSAYIGALAIVLVEHSNGEAFDDFIFIYEPAYLGQLKSSQVLSATGFFEIMVIISVVIGGIVVVYALLVYLIKLKRGYNNTNQLVEDDSSMNNKVQSDQIKFQISHQKVDKNSEQELHGNESSH